MTQGAQALEPPTRSWGRGSPCLWRGPQAWPQTRVESNFRRGGGRLPNQLRELEQHNCVLSAHHAGRRNGSSRSSSTPSTGLEAQLRALGMFRGGRPANSFAEAQNDGCPYRSGAAAGLGMPFLLADLDVRIRLGPRTDFTASLGICKWQGLGMVRPFDVQDLWIQQRVRSGDLESYKSPGKVNPGDLFTKFGLSQERIELFVHPFGCESCD